MTMRKGFIGLFLAISLILTMGMSSAEAAGVEYGWPSMEGEVAVRYSHNGAETTRLVVGETYSIQFWISGIEPYAINIPLAWNPDIVTIVDPLTGDPVESGKKVEGDVTGFRVGSKCYESDFDPWTYEPLYWNGRPVYTSDEVGDGGYPYLNAEDGHYRILFYDKSPNMPHEEQMVLEVFFRLDGKGTPFHIATSRDGEGRYDPTEPAGMNVIMPNGDGENREVNYTNKCVWPDIKVMTPEEYVKDATTPVDPDEKFPVDITQIGADNRYQGQIEVKVKLEKTEHLDCFPYTTAAKTNTVVRNVGGKVTLESDYTLPTNKISAIVNESDGTSRSILALMPDKSVPKSEYSVSFSMKNVDDMALNGFSMLYFETPLGYIGFNTAALCAQTRDDAQIRLTTNLYGVDGGMKLEIEVDGKPVESFQGATMRIIMPVDTERLPSLAAPVISDSDEGDESAARMYPAPMGQDMFKLGSYDVYPMGMHTYDEEHSCVIFLASVTGNYYLHNRQPAVFDDMSAVAWAVGGVDALSTRGIISGTSDTTFEPNGRVTREQFATMLVRAFGLYSPKTEDRFSDVAEDDFYAPFIMAAYTAQAVNGTSDTTFEPKANISRQDLCVVTYRVLTQLGVQLPQTRVAAAFKDDAKISDYAKEAVYALYGAGIVNGVGDETFDPTGTATRAEAAKILYGVLSEAEKLL